MELISQYADPARLTGMVRQALYDEEENRFQFPRWLPSVPIDDVNYEFIKGGEGLAEASMYRSWDAESPIGRREGLSKVMGELPPISEKIPLNEYDQIKMRQLTDEQVLRFVARDAQRLARNIGARFELARGDALFNGSVSINENGVVQSVTFGRNPAHSVTAATLWSDLDDSTPIDDLESWLETYKDTNGEDPAVILMPKAVFNLLKRNEQLRGQAFPQASTPPLLNAEQVRTVLDSQDFPTIQTYDAKVRVNGSTTRVSPADKIIFLPAPGAPTAGQETELGGLVMGSTVESREPEYGLAPGDQPGIVAAQWKTKDPVRVWTHAAAIGLPVLKNPDLTFVAEVA